MVDSVKTKKPGFRSYSRREIADTHFSRLLGLCGLSHPEAAEYLGIAEQSASQKAMGRRSMRDSEHDALHDLWKKIKDSSVPLAEKYPAGARRQQKAYAEAELDLLLRG